MIIAYGKGYLVRCGGLVGAALSCKVLGEGQPGVCVELYVVGAAAVALVGSSAPGGGGGWVLVVGHYFDVRVRVV